MRTKSGRLIIEIYDAARGTKRYVTQHEMRALGFEPPVTARQARKIEREILAARERGALHGREEAIGMFAARWPDDYRRGRAGPRQRR